MSAGFHPLLLEAIPDPLERASFVELMRDADGLMTGRETEVLFHGTTAAAATQILAEGMRPTMAFAADEEGYEYSCQGSFWGQARVAAWWAVSAAANRGGRPVLIAIRSDDLLAGAELGIDIPSRDFPQDYLKAFDDPYTNARWGHGNRRNWQDSLVDLGSASAIHDGPLDMDSAIIFDKAESLLRILGRPSFSA